jgi:hypothetical protein
MISADGGGRFSRRYADEMHKVPQHGVPQRMAFWDGRMAVYATTDGDAFEWGCLCDCLEDLERFLHQDQGAVYVHCYGGHGRAGVVAACLLGVMLPEPSLNLP